jgi:metallo-beta-lactamase family protein
MVQVRIGERRLTFTGDRGRPHVPILRDPVPVPACDLLISESTYGGITHEPVDETAERLGEVVRHTAERGGKLVIPAFAVGRTQTIIYFLHQLKSAGKLPEVPVFVDSPMAVKATEVFQSHTEDMDEEAKGVLKQHPELFGGGWVHYVESVHDSIALNDRPGPFVVISASGMCESGRVLHHLKHTIEDPRNTVLIAGFQAEHTLGRRIVERRPTIRILGREFALRAEVVVLNGLSSHADHGELVHDLAPLAAAGTRVRLVHGEPDRAAALAEGLRGVGFTDVGIPDRGETVTV